MPTRPPHTIEKHRSGRAPLLRAAVLGANDGIVSTAALMLGVAATSATKGEVLTAGVAGLVAGALSMAVGEFVSVGSQRDTELADLERERNELERYPESEMRELADIYVGRGLDRELAIEVARQMHDADALDAHARDELGLDKDVLAEPAQAAWASAFSFAVGASMPLLAVVLSPEAWRMYLIVVVALVALAALGVTGARLGGAGERRAAVRVLVGGGLAMAVTTLVGYLIGAV